MILLSNNWVVDNLVDTLTVWQEGMDGMWTVITAKPQDFQGGHIWSVIETIHGGLQATGVALLVLFFLAGVMKTCGSFAELKRPEHALKIFVRFAVAKGVVTYGMELMLSIFSIVQGIITNIMGSSGLGETTALTLPDGVLNAILDCGFFESIPLWIVTLIGTIAVLVMSLVMRLTVYGRIFKLYMYCAISPIPLATFAGEPTQNIGKSFVKSYAAVCLEGAVIVLACIIFSFFSTSPSVSEAGTSAVTIVWRYIFSIVFGGLVLVGSVKMSDRLVHEMMGL